MLEFLPGRTLSSVDIRDPANLGRLVLTVTSGGVDMAAFGASDWRVDYRKSFPNAAEWIYAPRTAAPTTRSTRSPSK